MQFKNFLNNNNGEKNAHDKIWNGKKKEPECSQALGIRAKVKTIMFFEKVQM